MVFRTKLRNTLRKTCDTNDGVEFEEIVTIILDTNTQGRRFSNAKIANYLELHYYAIMEIGVTKNIHLFS